MNKTVTVILIIAIVGVFAFYMYKKNAGEDKDAPPPPGTGGSAEDPPIIPGELEVNQYTAETSVVINPPDSANSSTSGMEIEVALSSVADKINWSMSWKGVTIEGITLGANYIDYSGIRFTAANGNVFDKLYDSEENGARFVITRYVGYQPSGGNFFYDPQELVYFMIFDTSNMLILVENLTYPSANYAKSISINSGVIATVKNKGL